MNFGSKYVYEYEGSEEEAVSDEEFQEGMSRALSSDRYVCFSMFSPDLKPK